MKKTIIIGIIFLFLIGIPMTSAVNVERMTYVKNLRTENPVGSLEEIPDWAIGNFTGVWGFNVNGEPYEDPLGLILGYYGEHLFAGLLTNTTAPNGWIWGIRFSVFMFGMVANLEGEQKIPIVGIGGFNEENFYYRFMSIVGPTFYMAGVYTPFE
jgi:hypothetical protein